MCHVHVLWIQTMPEIMRDMYYYFLKVFDTKLVKVKDKIG